MSQYIFNGPSVPARSYPQHATLIFLSLPETASLFFSTYVVSTHASQTVSHIFYKTVYDPPFQPERLFSILTTLCFQRASLECLTLKFYSNRQLKQSKSILVFISIGHGLKENM